MPLRDHFHPPLNRRHRWDTLHGQWPAMMVQQLAQHLPPDFTAGPQIHLGTAVEIDVGTYERHEPVAAAWPTSPNGAVATASWTATEPTLRVETDLPDVDEYEIRVYDVTQELRLVAAVEVISPANKDRPATRRAFVAKCAALLQQKVSVTIVDLVSSRDFSLYAELLSFLGQEDSSVATPPTPLYAVACRGTIPHKRWVLEAWHHPLTVGQPLPTLPLWLSDELAVPLDLEATYEETCQVLRIA